MRAAIIQTGKVINIIELPAGWSGAPGEWQQPAEIDDVVESLVAKVGDLWDGLVFTTPPHVPTEEEIEGQTMPPLIQQAQTYLDFTDLTVPADPPALSPTATAAQVRDYIITQVVPRLNGLDTLVDRTNNNTAAGQGLIKMLFFVAKTVLKILRD